MPYQFYLDDHYCNRYCYTALRLHNKYNFKYISPRQIILAKNLDNIINLESRKHWYTFLLSKVSKTNCVLFYCRIQLYKIQNSVLAKVKINKIANSKNDTIDNKLLIYTYCFSMSWNKYFSQMLHQPISNYIQLNSN